MTHEKTDSRSSYCTYPGEYVPAPLRIDELLSELQVPHEGAAAPLTNVLEEADAFTIEVAAPGLKTGDFLVSIRRNVLSVSVLHKEAACNKKYHQHEFNYRCFKREIELPVNIDTDFISAAYKNGILKIWLPKSKGEIVSDVERIIVY